MKRILAIATFFIAASATLTNATVMIMTSCGEVRATISEATFNEFVRESPTDTYEEYLRDINESICGTRYLPFVIDPV